MIRVFVASDMAGGGGGGGSSMERPQIHGTAHIGPILGPFYLMGVHLPQVRILFISNCANMAPITVTFVLRKGS